MNNPVMQAITILLLEVAQESVQPTREPQQLTIGVHRLVRWLEAMSAHDVVAHRALNLVRQLLGKQNRSRAFAGLSESNEALGQRRMNESSPAFWLRPDTHEDSDYARSEGPSWDPLSYTQQSRNDSTEVRLTSSDSAFATEQPYFVQNDMFSNPFDEYVDFSGGFSDFETWDAQRQQDDQRAPQ